MFKGLFLDDREQEARWMQFLSVEGDPGLTTEFKLVNRNLEDIAGEIRDYHPDILALDYRLDEGQDTVEVKVRYKAGPLAQQLRDYASDFPMEDFSIVLVSHENILKGFYRPDLTTHDLFDRIYEKEKLITDQKRINGELLALAGGYKDIINTWNDASCLSRLLGLADEEESKALLKNQELRQWKDLKAPHQLARKILRNIIDRNGLLRDRSSLLARLGIDSISPGIDTLLRSLSTEGVDYRGVFHGGWERWWDHRIEGLWEKRYDKELGNMTAKERAQCLNEDFGLNLAPAKSRWTGSDEMYSSFSCASCGHPTEKIHSVMTFSVYPVPSFVERMRICWECVSTGTYEDKGLIIDDAESYIVKKIEHGEIRKEA